MRMVHISCSIAGIWRLHHRHGWSRQSPARRALERDEHAVELWKKESRADLDPSAGPGRGPSAHSRRVRRTRVGSMEPPRGYGPTVLRGTGLSAGLRGRVS
ncbi:winged helix-turn-helix domain-containing protein [Streptomyces sp. NPDC005236]|uniref:winged helix-turn-helix domain-containing protein n=1 Tax=Streptomyces sp. NPDC005236 TaxID=3157028 RepID=UPI0033BB0BC4